MEQTYVYDLTCLISQQVSETPSGTVRVDLRYAHYFLNTHPHSTIFVKQAGTRLVIVSHEETAALVEHLQGNWETGKPASQPGIDKAESNLEFRMRYHGLWDPDLDTFFSMPFQDRFNFLLHKELTEIFGVEFKWVRRLPHVLKIWYALTASLSRYPAVFLLRSGQFIGVLLHTRSLSSAIRFISTRRTTETTLLDKVRENPEREYVYVYTAYNRGFPFDALSAIADLARLRYCVFIHDLIIIYYSEYFLPVNQSQQIAWMKHLLTLRPDIIVNSGETRRYLERFATEQQRETGRVTTAHIGVESCFLQHETIAPRENAGTYFVVIATIEPRKNHLLLLNLWREMAQQGLLDPLPELYLVGKRGWENENVVDMVERSKPLHGLVHEVPSLGDTELIALLKGARALLYPTFAEGWGMPVVEALTLGVPVLCSDIPELRESGQNIPDYLHPIDGLGWMQAIMDYCRDDSALRSAQLERMRDFIPPLWEAHFRQVHEEMFQADRDQ